MSFLRSLFGMDSGGGGVRTHVVEETPMPEAIEQRNDYGQEIPLGLDGVPQMETVEQWSNLLDMRDYGRQNSAGVRVTPKTAATVPAIFSACKIIAEGVATCPCKLYEPVAGGGTREAVEDDTYWIVKERPNNENTSVEYTETMVFTAALRGESVAYKKTTSRGKLLETYFLHPDRVQIKRRRGELTFEVTTDYDEENGARGPRKLYFRDDVVHLRGTSSDGVTAMSPVQMFVETIGQATAQYRHMGSLLRNGGAIRGLISTKEGVEITEEQMEIYESVYKEFVSGPANSGKALFLPGGFTFNGISLSPVDLALIEMFGLTVEDVSRIWRVPLHMLARLDRSTNNNIEHQSREFVRDCLRPWAIRIAKVYNRDLLTDKQRREGKFFRFDLDALLEGDSRSQAETFKIYLQNAVMNPNEVRGKLDMNPYEGGDKYMTQQQMVDINNNPAEMQDDDNGDENADDAPKPAPKKAKKDDKKDKKKRSIDPALREAIVGILADAAGRALNKTVAGIRNSATRSEHPNDFNRSLTVFLDDQQHFIRDTLEKPLKRIAQAHNVDERDVDQYVRNTVDNLCLEVRQQFKGIPTIGGIRTKAEKLMYDSGQLAEKLYDLIEAKEQDHADDAA